MILGIAFVWFTTHFGGGFASGAQIYTYYVKYGIWCLLMPVLAMLYNAVFFAYCLRFAASMRYMTIGRITTRFTAGLPRFFPIYLRCYICASCVSHRRCVCNRPRPH